MAIHFPFRSTLVPKIAPATLAPALGSLIASRIIPFAPSCPALEEILIDLFMDLDKYNYIGPSNYLEIWRELIQEYRMDIRLVHGYRKRRKCLEGIFSQLVEIKESYGIEVYQLLREVGKPL